MISLSRPFALIVAALLAAGSFVPPARAADAASWGEDYAAAVKEAQKDHKMILLNFTGSDWCPGCIELAKQVFSSPQFAQWAGKKLVLVEVDFPNDKPQTAALRKQNKALAAKFNIDAFPTILVLDSNEKEVTRTVGYDGSTPDDWIKARDAEIAKVQSK
jgi:thiol:disulfide interchange protein